MDCLFWGYHGISLLIKIVRAYFKKFFKNKKSRTMQKNKQKPTHNPTARDNIHKHTHTHSSRIFFYVGLWANRRLYYYAISRAVVFNLCIKPHLQIVTFWATFEGNEKLQSRPLKWANSGLRTLVSPLAWLQGYILIWVELITGQTACLSKGHILTGFYVHTSFFNVDLTFRYGSCTSRTSS